MNQEVKTINGYAIKDEKAVRTYDTVALLKADRKLKEGQQVKTRGYYSINDGGSAEYYITSNQSQSEHQENLENGLYATLIINNNEIIINQLGTKDESGFDCLSMFNKAFTINGITKIRLLKGMYRVSSTLIIPEGLTIEGTDNQFNASEIRLIENSSCLIKIETRNVTLKNIWFSKSVESDSINCILGDSYNGNHYGTKIIGCRIVGFNIGIRLTGSIWWQTTIEDTRVSLCNIGLSVVNTFAMYLKQFYTDRCTNAIALYGNNTMSFHSCNIGVISEGVNVLFGANGQKMNLLFEGCNFEYDEQLENSDGGFIKVSTTRTSDVYLTLINNRFTINGQNENVHSLAFNRHTRVTLLNNLYLPNNETDNSESFFNRLLPPALEIGSLKFLGGNESIPRPNYAGANKPTVLDLENNIIPKCNVGSEDLQFYTPNNGQLVYGDSDNVLYVYVNGNWKKIEYVNLQ